MRMDLRQQNRPKMPPEVHVNAPPTIV
ncbi:MAG: hypothetical protein II102_01945 [Bacteroidales bacterium]|nr:hypothetical protein [Bacteroidales bacterium]